MLKNFLCASLARKLFSRLVPAMNYALIAGCFAFSTARIVDALGGDQLDYIVTSRGGNFACLKMPNVRSPSLKVVFVLL